jgi:hypothetical protein
MNVQRINRVSGTMITILSLAALLAVLSGYFQAPQTDEGSAAHIFQLSIALLLPVGAAFLTTVDWTRPLLGMRRLILPAVVLSIAFAALYYLEHYYYLVYH